MTARMTARMNTEFDQLVVDALPFLQKYARKLCGRRDWSEAEDITQWAVVQMLANRDKFAMGTNFKAWAATILRNVLLTRYRSKQLRPEGYDPSILTGVAASERPADEVVLIKEIEQALGLLSKVQADALRRFYLDEQDQFEIAAARKCSPATVRSRLNRGRERLKVLLGEENEDVEGVLDHG